MIIDAHIHLDHYEEKEQHEILSTLDKHKVEALISVSFDMESCLKTRTLSINDSRVKPAYGFHPEQDLPSEDYLSGLISWMEQHADEMVAVGEVGLPYYKKIESERSLNYEPYLALLERFIEFAAKWDKPIILHAVYEDAALACDLLEKHEVTKAHFHWFKGDQITVERMIRNGYFISITPDVLYEDEIQELVKSYPLQQMMVETDGPWPFEGPFTNQMTEPKMIHDSIKNIAELKGMPVSETERIVYENTKRFYRI
ncbi:TatD family hydrolase [Ureibacillus manganicus]|uniref:DNAase n=1 Tax=Ureibacillus manganicus DSM 26584 TaxID=1384049 RepID=A0A0A3IR52_9BACL|nr:TatD family hydrolase [Ureibacillus manganicus]KGR77282.1 DNAase [Ureibacillus manganicus DSM 26584]